MDLATTKLILTIVSGLCWTIVYVDGIRVGLRDKSYAIPFYALALNFAWELLYTILGFRAEGATVQNVINAIWFTFDIGILYTYFRFGAKDFVGRLFNPSAHTGTADMRDQPPAPAGRTDFIAWSVLGLITAFAVQYGFRREFGIGKGASYSAFAQNLLMSVLFIGMLARRGSRAGQSLTIAVSKWIGTLAPTILYGALGEGSFSRGSFLILTLGIFCSVFDLIYIWLLARMKPAPATVVA